MMTGYDEIPPDHDCKKEITEKPQAMEEKKCEEKTAETTEEKKSDNDILFNEWATKIYWVSEETYKELLRLRFLMDRPTQKEKFTELMCEKQFGKFISVFKSKSQLSLYVRIDNHEMATDYYPSRHHIEKIKNFLDEQGENWLEVTQQIIMQLGAIPIAGRLVRRNILYPEFTEMEKQNSELKERLKEKDKQLRLSLNTWLYFIQCVESDMHHTLPRIYAMMNEIGKE